MTFSERLDSCIRKAGYKQIDLAKMLDITPTRLNYWVKGKRQPEIIYIKKLAEILNVSADYLIGNDDFSNEPKFSEAAMRIAALYDKMDEHGKELLNIVANLQVKRLKESNAFISFKSVPHYGTAYQDGRVETKYAAKQEQKEMLEDLVEIKE